MALLLCVVMVMLVRNLKMKICLAGVGVAVLIIIILIIYFSVGGHHSSGLVSQDSYSRLSVMIFTLASPFCVYLQCFGAPLA